MHGTVFLHDDVEALPLGTNSLSVGTFIWVLWKQLIKTCTRRPGDKVHLIYPNPPVLRMTLQFDKDDSGLQQESSCCPEDLCPRINDRFEGQIAWNSAETPREATFLGLEALESLSSGLRST